MVQPRKHSSLAQKLLAGFPENFLSESTVVFNFLKRTAATFQSQVLSKVNISHAACTDALTDFITTAKYLSNFEGEWHAGLQNNFIGSVQFFISAFVAQNNDFLLYYKRVCNQFLMEKAKLELWAGGGIIGRWSKWRKMKNFLPWWGRPGH
jgi:hypothetical protein